MFWQQDVYSVAMRGTSPAASCPCSAGPRRAVRTDGADACLPRSDRVVVISEDFLPTSCAAGASTTTPITWSRTGRHSTSSPAPAACNGLGRGSRPRRSDRAALLRHARPEAQPGPAARARSLARRPGRRPRRRRSPRASGPTGCGPRSADDPAPALMLLPFQPYEVLPEVLASADVLIAILEPDAGVFSVPSKVLSYHCAGRPILAAIPAENLAARIIERERHRCRRRPDRRARLRRAARRPARTTRPPSRASGAAPAPTPRPRSTSTRSPTASSGCSPASPPTCPLTT